MKMCLFHLELFVLSFPSCLSNTNVQLDTCLFLVLDVFLAWKKLPRNDLSFPLPFLRIPIPMKNTDIRLSFMVLFTKSAILCKSGRQD
jgi:hypothetical protein